MGKQDNQLYFDARLLFRAKQVPGADFPVRESHHSGALIKTHGGHPGAKFVSHWRQEEAILPKTIMISLQNDFTEPDYEALAARLTAATGIPWFPADVKMWSELFRTLAPGSDESSS